MRELLRRIHSEERGDAYHYGIGGGTILTVALIVLLLIILL
jgi:hypothetical protein